MIGIKPVIRLLLIVIFGGCCSVLEVYAQDLGSASARLTDESFRLLNQLSSHDADHPNPLVGPVAVFAGDADGLHRALTSGDLPSAHSRMASLQADAGAIDLALNQSPRGTAADRWSVLRREMSELANEIQQCGEGFAAPRGSGQEEGKRGRGCQIKTADSEPGPPIRNDINVEGDSPRILITARESAGGFLRLKGYFEGTALRSAGIFEGSSQLKALKLSGTPGRQRVDFDLRLEEPSSATTLRVSDSAGRTAESSVLDGNPAVTRLPPPTDTAPDSAPPIASKDGDEAMPNAGEDPNTGEIPSHGPLMPSPSKRHTLVSRLGDAQIQILSVARTSDFPPIYEVVGQIEGRGITRAGIYANGRLLQSIPVVNSADYTDFRQRIMVRQGSIVIRAYTAGNNFVEQPIDFAGDSETSLPYNSRLTNRAHPRRLGSTRQLW